MSRFAGRDAGQDRRPTGSNDVTYTING